MRFDQFGTCLDRNRLHRGSYFQCDVGFHHAVGNHLDAALLISLETAYLDPNRVQAGQKVGGDISPRRGGFQLAGESRRLARDSDCCTSNYGPGGVFHHSAQVTVNALGRDARRYDQQTCHD